MTQNSQHPLRSPRASRYILEGAAVLLLVSLTLIVGVLIATRPSLRYASQAASLEETVMARVLKVDSEQAYQGPDIPDGMTTLTQELELEIIGHNQYTGQRVTVTYNGVGPTPASVRFRAGDKALVRVSTRPDGKVLFQVADHVRLLPLTGLTLLFILVTVLVGRWQGVRALLGLILSGLLVGGFILPQILSGRDPVLVSLAGTALLLAVTLYLIQGWNAVGHAAAFGMLGSLALAGLLALWWTHASHLTGFGSEETMYLQASGVKMDMRGLLLAGIIIGSAGVLDDVILAQAVAIFEFMEADPTQTLGELVARGMKIGVAHLTSMINTLVMAYAGVSLPLIILFYLYTEPWYLTINRELIAEEIIRTLVGSIGLMAAVPLTNFIAAWIAVTQEQVEA